MQDLSKEASTDLSTLGRVSHRLAMTDAGPQLEKVLTLLLPRLLRRIGTNHAKKADLTKQFGPLNEMGKSIQHTYDAIHAKLVEMMSHIIKRVRADPSCKLPCDAIIDILYDSDEKKAHEPTIINPFTLNLSLTFLTIGITRCPVEQLETILPGLLAIFGAHSTIASLTSASRKNQSYQVAHLVLRVIEGIVVGKRQMIKSSSSLRSTTTTTSSSSSSAGTNHDKESSSSDVSPPSPSPMQAARDMCTQNETISAAVYELILDVLLYTNSNSGASTSNLPPPGLSQSGKERLASGNSPMEKNWIVEHSKSNRLRDLKCALLDFIAPCRRMDLFDISKKKKNSSCDQVQVQAQVQAEKRKKSNHGLCTARVVALLVVASGDHHQDVAERSASFLKAHLDSSKNKTSLKNESDIGGSGSGSLGSGVGSGDYSWKEQNEDEEKIDPTSALVGNPIALTCELLRLVLGDVVGSNAIKKAVRDTSDFETYLGSNMDEQQQSGNASANSNANANANVSTAIVMSTKRRMISVQNATTIMTFSMGQIFEDIPSIFIPPRKQKQKEYSSGDYFDSCGRRAIVVGTLVLMSANKYASSGNSLSGLSTTGTAGNPSVAAIKLLNFMCIRLTALYDAMIVEEKNAMSDADEDISSTLKRLHNLLAKAFMNACAIISVASSANSGDVRNKIGIEARDSAYGIICTIARSCVTSSEGNFIFHCGNIASDGQDVISIETAKSLFGCVCNEAETLRPRAIAALDSLLAAYCKLLEQREAKSIELDVGVDLQSSNPWAMAVDTDESKSCSDRRFDVLGEMLIPLLWNHAHPKLPKGSRHAAAQWANSLLKSLHLTAACHLLCFIAGDEDGNSAAIAIDGLSLTRQIGKEIGISTDEGKDFKVPDFNQFIQAVFAGTSGGSTSWRPAYNNFSPKGKGAAIRFGLVCLLSDLYGNDVDASVTKMLHSISNTLLEISKATNTSSKNAPAKIELLDESAICLSSLLKTSKLTRHLVMSLSGPLSVSKLAELSMSVSSSKARRYLAATCLLLFEDNENGPIEFDEWIMKSSVDKILKTCTSTLGEMTSVSFTASKIHGAAYLGASCFRALRLFAIEKNISSLPEVQEYFKNASEFIKLLGRGTLHSEDVIGQACAASLSIAFSYENEDSPKLSSPLLKGTSSCLTHMHSALRRYGNGDNADASRASLLAEAAGAVLAASTVRETGEKVDIEASSDIGKRRLDCVDALFALIGSSTNRKDPEISLVVGEALSKYADAYSPEGCQWTYPKGPVPSTFNQEYASELPPHSQVIYTVLCREVLATNPHKRTSCAPVLLALVGRAARAANADPTVIQRRQFIKEIYDKLSEIQRSLLKLLADPKSKQIGRESCQLGLTACYGLSNIFHSLNKNCSTSNFTNALNEQLLRAFGQTSRYSGSAMMETRDQQSERTGAQSSSTNENYNEAEVGGVDGMGEAALGAFREMASVAVVLERADILYSLLVLSVSLPLWRTSSYNSSSLLGRIVDGHGNIEEIRQALRPHMEKLIPRLLRACNDPNKQTRDQMTSLWVKLTGGGADARILVNKYFLHTLDSLMDDATSKLWRVRVGSCTSIAEIIVGRSWSDLGGGDAMERGESIPKSSNSAAARLLRLFRVTVRSLDDVRINVREAGGMLSRSVRGLTTRLCDPSVDLTAYGPYATVSSIEAADKITSSAAAAATILPWLVQYGLNQPCAEATGFSVSCLLNIVQVSRAATLQPVLPELIGSLLMSMSGLEPAALNYLQERAAGRDSSVSEGSRYDRLERVRLQMAQSGPMASALSKCLDMLKQADVEFQKAVIPQLDSALRCGAGFATRAAAADAVSSLCTISPAAFKFSGNSTSNPTVRLLRALYYASERERGAGARGKMTHALGNLAALAPGTSVRNLATRLCERYNNASGGTNDDPSARKAAAAALRAIAIRASNQFGDGGTKDVWIKHVLPLAFMARHDKEIGSMFEEIWDEGGQAARLTDSVAFGLQLQEAILPYLTKALTKSLQDVSWTRRRIACATLIELSDTNILGPVPRAVDDNVAMSDDLQQRLEIRAQSSCFVLNACVNLLINTRLWTGKSELVRTVAKIAGNWARHGSDDVRVSSIFGAGESDKIFEWIPVKLENTRDDLFVGDQWFLLNEQTREEMNMPDSDLTKSVEDAILTEGEETDIDFEEGDEILKDDKVTGKDDDNITELLDSKGGRTLAFNGLCRLLLDQGLPPTGHHDMKKFFDSDYLGYRAAVIESLSSLLGSISEVVFTENLKNIFDMVCPRLLSTIMEGQVSQGENVPPLIIAKCFNCFSSAIFTGIDESSLNKLMHFDELNQLFLDNCGPKQPGWTVREASGLSVAKVIKEGDLSMIKKMKFIENCIECTNSCLKDRKFWRVRNAGLKSLLAFCARTGTQSSSRNIGMGTSTLERSTTEQQKQLCLEAILPYKERILVIARSSLSDNESKVMSTASEILAAIGWWP